jgi:hypothetical protein
MKSMRSNRSMGASLLNEICRLLAYSLLVVGCSLGGCFQPSSDELAGPDPNFIETDLTEPGAVIESFSKAFTKRNYDAYAALLDADFEFCPLSEDAQDFPWLESPCWDRATELGIIANMFDPNYAGPGHPVMGNELECTELGRRALGEGSFELTCTLQGRVMTDSNDGWSFDTRALFTLVTRDGFLRIRRITEVGAGRSRSVEQKSWGRIKAGYRDAAGRE